MNCKHRKQKKAQAKQYASSEDFCRLFSEHLNSLYWLAFLLTADQEKAEQCFVAGLQDSVQSNRVFRSWAHPWAKRTIIENAIHALKPRPGMSVAGASIYSSPLQIEADSEFRRVLAMEDFERFIFVMSVLERYSDHECSLLLDCPTHDIREARSRAFQEIADSVSEAQGASFVRPKRKDDPITDVHTRQTGNVASQAH